ncbi:hypothetical protein CEXT_307311 [Caerostris extrusa]|uniref:RING-type domain-containing protein n=1 Tax=Caerostris extrusa TaxID=172846 RepID=A0AAV4WYV8_CAEEX|nr:hypothetical protein CEXT_307311 [Caerostris extrusa]
MDPPSGQFIAHVQIPKNFRIYYMTENKSSQVHEALIEENGECQSQADILTIQQVVRKDLFEKYDKMLLHRSLETMPDVTFCPRKFCQCALVIDVQDRMGTCPRCRFVFCPFCNMTYHGVAPCVFKSKEKQLYLISI